MAGKQKAPPAAAVALSYYHPTEAELLAAGFKISGPGFSWYDTGGRWHLLLYLLPKTGEVFIYHNRLGTSEQQRNQTGTVPPNLTSVGTRAEFSTLLKRYGWKHKPPPPPPLP